MDPLLTTDLFTDATPWSIAAVLTSYKEHFAQAFEQRTEQNRAELIAALQGLIWASSIVRDTKITVYTDNAATFCALRSGTGKTLRQHDIRRLYLSMLHQLHGNTYEVATVTGATNPADKPSRDVLRTLHAAAQVDLPEDSIESGFYEVTVT